MSRKYALIGDKLGHTLSPPIHKRLFELRGREFSYELLEIDPAELDGKKAQLRELSGYNVTIPHKPAIIAQLDKLDESAKRYGAVNCVDNKGGASVGYNTDCDGFLRSVRAEGGRLDGSVLLLGAGGVGRMMAIEAALAGAELYIAVLMSDFPLAQQAAKEIITMKPDADITIVEIGSIDTSLHYDLLMNATPVGMYPKTDACAVSDDVIACADAVFDVIYNPGETQLLQKAKALGKKCSGGMAMLVYQAVSAHEIWDGDSYDDKDIAQLIADMEKLVEEKFNNA